MAEVRKLTRPFRERIEARRTRKRLERLLASPSHRKFSARKRYRHISFRDSSPKWRTQYMIGRQLATMRVNITILSRKALGAS